MTATMQADEHTLLIESAQSAVADFSPVAALRRLRDQGAVASHDPGFWAACSDLGWTGVLVDPAQGGSALGSVAAGLIAREMGRTLALSPFVGTAMMAVAALSVAASSALSQEWLPRIAAGGVVLAPAFDEARRHDPETCAATAERSGSDFILTARKIGVMEANSASAFLVAARLATKAPSSKPALFLVPATAPGISVTATRLMDGRSVGAVDFRNVIVDKASLLGEGALAAALLAGRAGLASRQCGLAEGVFRLTLDYLKQRRQFDRVIGSFQALQHRSAAIHCEIENAWSATLRCLTALDENDPQAELHVSVAKAKAADVACAVAAECLQFHGGIGMTDELDIGLFLKQSRVEADLLGGHSYHAEQVARQLGF